MIDLTLRCPVCDRRADMCFEHGDDWKKRGGCHGRCGEEYANFNCPRCRSLGYAAGAAAMTSGPSSVVPDSREPAA